MNALPEDLYRDVLIPFLTYEDQMQLFDCSTSYYHHFKKLFRRICLTEANVTDCLENEEYLRKINSLIGNSEKQLIMQGLSNYALSQLPFQKFFCLRAIGCNVFLQLNIQQEPFTNLKIETAQIHIDHSTQGFLQSLLQLCEGGIIKHLKLLSFLKHLPPLPYFPQIESLLFSGATQGIALSLLYSSHLQSLELLYCQNFDVSSVGSIPRLILIECSEVKGLSNLSTPRLIQLSDVTVQKPERDLFFPVCKVVKCSNSFTPDSSFWRLDLSKCHNLQTLDLLRVFVTPSSSSNTVLPSTIHRASFGGMILSDHSFFTWSLSLGSLQELRLVKNESLADLSAFAIDQIPLVECSFLSGLQSLEGLREREGGKKRKTRIVIISYCPLLDWISRHCKELIPSAFPIVRAFEQYNLSIKCES